MSQDQVSRRSLLTAAGMIAALPAASQPLNYEIAAPQPESGPQHTIRFAVIGLDHTHIYGITDTIRRGGGELVSVHSTNYPALAEFQRRYPGVKVARAEEEILNDASIQAVCSAAIPDLRSPLGIRAMRHDKDFLSDKPAITTLDQLADVRRAIRETRRMFAIMYGRMESRATLRAGELVKDGAIGRVIQTIQLAPHRVNEPTRPEWFWDPERYGGTLCDLGSHQADEFVFFTGSTTADVSMSQVANVNYRHRAKFQDFGDMMVTGNGGLGYFRVDWLTPDGLGAYGDERTFILGTEGYIEMRKTIDIAGRPAADHVFIVDRKSTRYIDCKNLTLPFGPQFVSDVVNRTRLAQDQEAALLATELVLKGQKNARMLQLRP
ncbi:MAG TPA: Gfo/Idh/MocA family oxidoreductase [Bryobacteraceae bacterium]|nr:Gfo/Idh/MocA family oxidoreductase [Bryobacteraceae bacterium]